MEARTRSQQKQRRAEADVKTDEDLTVPPGALSTDQGKVEEKVGAISEKNYVTELLNANIWLAVLEYLTDPQDITSLMEAAPVLRSDSLLEKRRVSAQLLLMIPILMEKGRLTPTEILKFRLMNKQAKAKMDELLTENAPSWFPETAYRIHEPKKIQVILNRSKRFIGSPFIAKHSLITCDDSPEQLEILRRHGQELRHAELEVLSVGVEEVMQDVERTLPYLTNVEVLNLSIMADGVWNIEDWNGYRSVFEFPVLSSLSTLKLDRWRIDDSYVYEDCDIAPTASYVRPILLAYGNQLTNLTCDGFVFEGGSEESISFPNLRRFKVSFPIEEGAARLGEVYGNLAKISCPRLTSLTLSGDGMQITCETILALNNFAGSLQELHLESLEGNPQVLHEIDPAELIEFPRLTRLTLCTADAGTGWRHLFRVMFTKLEEIRFERPIRWGNRTVSLGILNARVRRGYFTLFPNLNRIVCITEGAVRFRNIRNEIVFKQEN